MKKLEHTPEVPHTIEDVMRAMTELHKLVLAQSHAYGGKNSKYLPAQVLEGSLLKQVSEIDEDHLFEGDDVKRLLDIAREHVKDLASYLKSKKDTEGLSKLGNTLKMIGAAIAVSKDIPRLTDKV
jgi:hypothetical protein